MYICTWLSSFFLVFIVIINNGWTLSEMKSSNHSSTKPSSAKTTPPFNSSFSGCHFKNCTMKPSAVNSSSTNSSEEVDESYGSFESLLPWPISESSDPDSTPWFKDYFNKSNKKNNTGNKTQEYMRCVVLEKFGKPDVLHVQTVIKPSVEKREVLIKVKAAGINPVDTYIREGIHKVLPPLPTILGKEVAGVIEEIGPNAKNQYNFKVGDRVVAILNKDGGYCEYIKTNIKNVFPLLGNLSFSQGASIYVTYFTAYRALILRSKIDFNESLFIHGASGGVGTAAVQIASYLGVTKIGATAGTEEGMKMLKDLGADYVFNHRKKGHIHEAKLAMGDTGFDVILENAAEVFLEDDCSVLAPGGRIAVVGCRGSIEITPRSLMVTEGQILGVNLGKYNEEELQECIDFIVEGMEDGWVKPVVGREYLIEEAAKAHDDMIYKSSSHGKLVFRIEHKEIPEKIESNETAEYVSSSS